MYLNGPPIWQPENSLTSGTYFSYFRALINLTGQTNIYKNTPHTILRWQCHRKIKIY